MQVVGLDLGRHNTKVYTGDKYISFPSVVGEWRDLKLINNYGPKAFDVTYEDGKYFVGTLAENESEFARQMLIEDKATTDALILALVGLHKTNHSVFDVVTGLPVHLHTPEHKRALMTLLEGEHIVTVNNERKKLIIKRARVSVEGGGGFWSKAKDGSIRIIDGGSKTINYITLNNKRYVDRESGTLNFGFDTNKSNDKKQLAKRIAGELGRKWNQHDEIYVIGGEAAFLVEALRPYFPLIQVLHTNNVLQNGEIVDLNLFANAIGYYNIGLNVKV